MTTSPDRPSEQPESICRLIKPTEALSILTINGSESELSACMEEVDSVKQLSAPSGNCDSVWLCCNTRPKVNAFSPLEIKRPMQNKRFRQSGFLKHMPLYERSRFVGK